MTHTENFLSLVETLNQKNRDDYISFKVGRGGWPEIILKHSNDSLASISLYGGHLLEWQVDGSDVLFLSGKADYTPGKAIRGGIPVIFPWFGKGKNMPQSHGFARNMLWEFRSSCSDRAGASATIRLRSSETTKALWPHDFDLEIKYTLTDHLRADVKIKNNSKEKIHTQFALHTYFSIQDISAVSVSGLQGCDYLDNAQSGMPKCHDVNPVLHFEGLIDRAYLSVPGHVSLYGGSSAKIEIQSDLKDRVCWNPGQESGAKLSDLPVDGYKKFVCVESGCIGAEEILAPDQTFTCYQEIVRGGANLS